jgi:hypothetical protein
MSKQEVIDALSKGDHLVFAGLELTLEKGVVWVNCLNGAGYKATYSEFLGAKKII